MPPLDDPTLRIDRPRPDFRAANPEAFGRAQGDLDTTRRLAAVETRATAIKDRFRAHFERHELAWVAQEASALKASKGFPTLQHPKPSWAERDNTNLRDLMNGQARRNVHARALQRLSAINASKTRLQNALVRNAPGPAPSNDRGRSPTPAVKAPRQKQ